MKNDSMLVKLNSQFGYRKKNNNIMVDNVIDIYELINFIRLWKTLKIELKNM